MTRHRLLLMETLAKETEKLTDDLLHNDKGNGNEHTQYQVSFDIISDG